MHISPRSVDVRASVLFNVVLPCYVVNYVDVD